MPALQVRLSEEEYASCKEKARVAGVSMSEWVRGRLFDGDQSAGVLAGPRRPRPLPPRVPVNAPDAPSMRRPAVRKRAPIAAEIPEIPAFEELEVPEVSLPADVSVLPGLTPEECEGVLLSGSVALPDGRVVVVDSPPASLFPTEFDAPYEQSSGYRDDDPPAAPLPGPPRHKFKRHPKCTVEKCERIGNCCPLCKLANAISF